MRDANQPESVIAPKRVKPFQVLMIKFVEHILVVAGPSGAGKSTFLRQLRAGKLPPDLQAELPPDGRYWPQFGVRKKSLDGLVGKQFSGLVLHCDLTKLGEINRVALRRSFSEVLKAAGSVTVVEIYAPMGRLISHMMQRAFATDSKAIANLMRFTLTPRFMIFLAASKLRLVSPHFLKRQSKTRKQVEKLTLYQQRGHKWFEAVHEQWISILQLTRLSGVSVKLIQIEPNFDAGIGSEDHAWRRLLTNENLQGSLPPWFGVERSTIQRVERCRQES